MYDTKEIKEVIQGLFMDGAEFEALSDKELKVLATRFTFYQDKGIRIEILSEATCDNMELPYAVFLLVNGVPTPDYDALEMIAGNLLTYLKDELQAIWKEEKIKFDRDVLESAHVDQQIHNKKVA